MIEKVVICLAVLLKLSYATVPEDNTLQVQKCDKKESLKRATHCITSSSYAGKWFLFEVFSLNRDKLDNLNWDEVVYNIETFGLRNGIILSLAPVAPELTPTDVITKLQPLGSEAQNDTVNGAIIRRKFCGIMTDMLTCIAKNTKFCFSWFEQSSYRIDFKPDNAANEAQSSPPMNSIIKMGSEIQCILCARNAEGLKVALRVLHHSASETHKQIVNRISKQCNVTNSQSALQILRPNQMRSEPSLTDEENSCSYRKLAHCVYSELYNFYEPNSNQNALASLIDLLITHGLTPNTCGATVPRAARSCNLSQQINFFLMKPVAKANRLSNSNLVPSNSVAIHLPFSVIFLIFANLSNFYLRPNLV